MIGPGPVLVIGAACRDVDPDDPTKSRWRLGGGVAYAALVLARLGVATRAIIGLDATAATAPELPLLQEAGVTVTVHPLGRGAVFQNLETPGGRVQTVLEASDPVPVDALPRAWTTTPTWLFAPVADELPDAWAAVPAGDEFVALGWQGLLRDLRPGERVTHRSPQDAALVRRADLIGVGSDDLSSTTDLEPLGALVRQDATVVLTRSESGGLVLRSDGERLRTVRRYAAVTAVPRDPTGAGDAFLAALVAARLGAGPSSARGPGDPFPTPDDLRFAATVAALAVEGDGLAGVPDGSAVRRRMRAGHAPG